MNFLINSLLVVGTVVVSAIVLKMVAKKNTCEKACCKKPYDPSICQQCGKRRQYAGACHDSPY